MLGEFGERAFGLVGDADGHGTLLARVRGTRFGVGGFAGLRHGHYERIAKIDTRVVERVDRGAASETGIPVVISSRCGRTWAALSEVPRATKHNHPRPPLPISLLKRSATFNSERSVRSSAFRLLPDLFQHAGHSFSGYRRAALRGVIAGARVAAGLQPP